jgi:hypothetical protein
MPRSTSWMSIFGFPGWRGALAVDSVLSHEDKCICKHIQRHGEASSRYAHLCL